MNFSIVVEPLKQSDINRNAPYVPEDDEVEMSIIALFEDIQSLDWIEDVARDGFNINAKSRSGFTSEELMGKLRPILTSDVVVRNLRISFSPLPC